MSTSVENRVVSMEFDNAKFERNVKESLDTLKHLDKSLDGLKDNSNKFNSISFSNLVNQIDYLCSRWSFMGVLTTQVFTRISNSIINVGAKIGEMGRKLERFNSENLQAGWSKYGDKTTSVQTIMSATGKTIEEVSDQLERLNRFTDETSYSFVDMTSNIAKFTGQGIDLDKSVVQMEGIATWAASAGQNAESASRAMYNISQAMGVGYMQLIDWRSIQNANMATKEFKEQAMNAAVAVGSLVRQGDKFVTAGSNVEVTISNFQETLKEGWLNTATMETVFSKYGEFAVVIDELSQSTGLTVTDLLELAEAQEIASDSFEDDLASAAEESGMKVEDLRKEISKLNSEELSFSKATYRAAQQAKTFRDAIDATKDAASTAWMNLFETIFGNYEEARVLWTDIAGWLYDIFAEPINSIESVFDEIMNGTEEVSSGTTILKDVMDKTGVDLSKFGDSAISALRNHGLLTEEIENNSDGIADAMSKVTGSSLDFKAAIQEMLESGSKGTKDLKESFEEYKKVAEEVLSGKWDNGSKRHELLKEAGYDPELVQRFAEKIHLQMGFVETDMEKVKDATEGYSEEQIAELEKLMEALEETSEATEETEKTIKKLTGRELLFGTEEGARGAIYNLMDIIDELRSSIADAFTQIFDIDFGDKIYGILVNFNSLTKGILESLKSSDKIERIFKGIFAAYDIFRQLSGSVVSVFSKIIGIFNIGGIGLSDLIAGFFDWIVAIDESIKKNETFKNTIETIFNFIDSLKQIIVPIATSIGQSFQSIINNIVSLFNVFKNSSVGTFLTDFKEYLISQISASFTFLSDSIKNFSDTFGKAMEDTLKIANTVKQDFDELIKAISSIFINNNFNDFTSYFESKLQSLGDSISKLGESIGIAFEDIDYTKIYKVLLALSSIFVLIKLYKSINVLAGFAKSILEIGKSFGEFFKSLSKSIKANTILKISAAVLVLVGALVLLTFIPADRLIPAMAAIGVILVSLIIMMSIVAKISKSAGAAEMSTIAAVIIAFSVGVLALIAAVKMLEEIKWVDFLNAFGKLVIIMASFLGSIVLISHFAGTGAITSIGILAFAGSVLLITLALKRIQKDLSDLPIKAFDKFFIICGILAAISLAMKNVRAGAGISLLLFVVSVMLVQKLLKKMVYGSISWDQVEEFLKRFEVIFVMMAALSVLSRISGKGSIKAAILLLSFIGTMFIVAELINRFNEFTGGELAKGITTILFIAGSFALVLSQAGKLAASNKYTSASMIAIVAGMSILLIGLIAITNMIKNDGKAVASATVILLVIILGLAVVMRALTKIANTAANINTVFVILSVIGLLGAILIGLKVIEGIDTDGMLKKVGSVGLLLLELAGILGILAFASKYGIKVSIKDALVLIAATLSIVSIALALKQLNGIDLSNVNMSGIINILISLMAALGIISVLNKFVGTMNVLAAVGILDLLIGSLGLIFIGLAELASKADGLEAGALRIGRAIGSFVGGIVGGFKDASMGNLPKMAEDISAFMENIQPFLTNSNGVPNGIETRITQLVGAIKVLSEAKLDAAEAAILEKKKKVDAFGSLSESMLPLADSINKLSSGTQDVSTAKIDAIGNAISAIAQIMNAIPEEGGISGWFTGEKDLGSFGTNLSSLVGGLSEFITASNSIEDAEGSIEKVSILKNIFDTTNEMAKSLEATDSVLSYIIGRKDLGSFGDSLYNFIGNSDSGFSGFISAVNSISDLSGAISKVEDIKSIFDNANEMAKNVARSESVIDKIIGRKDLGSFGDSLKNFIGTSDSGFIAFITAVNGINNTATAVAKVADIKSIFDNANEMSKALEREDGIIQKIVGSKNLGSFGSSLSTFIGDDSSGLIAFINKASNIPENAKEISERIKDSTMPMVNIAEVLPGLLTNIALLPDTGTSVTPSGNFAASVTSYISSIGGIINSASMLPEDSVEKAIILEQAVISASKVIRAMPTSKDIKNAPTVEELTAWSDSLKVLLNAMTIDVGTASSETISQVTADALSGIQTSSINVISSVTNLVNTVVSVLTSTVTSARQIGMYVGIGFANGMSGELTRVKQAASELGSAATNALAAAAKVQSPSKEGIRIGGFVGLGYAIGLVSKTSEVKTASTELANTALNTVEYAASMINDILESDGTPTIRPVLDLSEVRSEAKTIRGLGSTMSFNVASSIAHTRRLNGGSLSGGTGTSSSVVGPTYNLVIDGIRYNTDEYVDASISNFVEMMVRKNKMYAGR